MNEERLCIVCGKAATGFTVDLAEVNWELGNLWKKYEIRQKTAYCAKHHPSRDRYDDPNAEDKAGEAPGPA